MRMSVWDKPRVIGNAENYPQHIALPRGCLEAALDLLRSNRIDCDLRDERFNGLWQNGHCRRNDRSLSARTWRMLSSRLPVRISETTPWLPITGHPCIQHEALAALVMKVDLGATGRASL